ncbi:mast/stem cell growth factor receptor Kit-like isoform X2 [Petromyzon marinus]|uniref:mast/stem cell growth factor receptor Kit-like isoform X2 n=1 Tax=Petromyzon marinus TaxID=7757 RepID=UPI003F712341
MTGGSSSPSLAGGSLRVPKGRRSGDNECGPGSLRREELSYKSATVHPRRQPNAMEPRDRSLHLFHLLILCNCGTAEVLAGAVAPRVKVEPPFAVVRMGDPLHFRCSVQFEVKNIELRWTHLAPTESSWVKRPNEYHIISPSLHELKGAVSLDRAARENAGMVRCQGKDLREGGLSVNVTANVTVLDRGVLELSLLNPPGPSTLVARGDSLELNVGVLSVPPLSNCTWLHHGVPVINASPSQDCEDTARGHWCKCTLSLRRIVPVESGTYSLAAHNGDAHAVISVNVSMASESPRVAHQAQRSGARQMNHVVPALGAATLAMTFIAGYLFYRYKQKPHYEVQWKIIDSLDHDTNEYIYIDPGKLAYDPRRWEVDRATLDLGETLGTGAFGEVVVAAAHGLHGQEGCSTRVAVKRLKKSARVVEREALRMELKVLCHVGQHPNIVNLLGACTEREPVLLITEYCCHGDLLTFLRAHSPKGAPKPGLAPQHSVYGNLVEPGGSEEILKHRELLSLCLQVAGGMAFLESKKCLHRDVAARNVLLAQGFLAKICDFGLARDVTRDPNYIQRGNARLPVKWMAPESVFDCVFSLKSDVWSYGVLVWEIYSYGESPYPHLEVDDTFFRLLQDGYRMEVPKGCPPAMYELMLLCWDTTPAVRPAFRDIEALLAHMMPRSEEKGSMGLETVENLFNT